MTQNSTAVALATTKPPVSLLIRPAASVADIVIAWQDYQNLKTKLLNENDYQMISGKNCIKKSGWRKIQTAFSISDELMNEERKEFKDYFIYEVTVKATAPNGRFAFGIGSCASNERKFSHVEHDVRSTAHTRAKNRAIADLVGGGDVSAEEVDYDHGESKDENLDSNYFNQIFQEREPEMARVDNGSEMTGKQKKYLISLVNERIADNDERELKLEWLESGISRQEASEAISDLLSA
jgi:hypothetical protein